MDVQTNSKITGKRTSKMESSADDPPTWAIRQGHDVQITALGGPQRACPNQESSEIMAYQIWVCLKNRGKS